MKKLSVVLFVAAAFLNMLSSNAQTKGRQIVMFYNVENLFDTINDPAVNDEEFLPEGPKKWNSVKYNRKMSNLERVFFTIASENKRFPAVIGVSEVENRNVLEDIVSLEKLQPANYQIMHYDGPDLRGVDVAFLYRPDVFRCQGSATYPVRVSEMPDWRTRDILTMWGTIEEDPFCFIVCHWPSRSGGQERSAPLRAAAAGVVRHVVDSIHQVAPETKVVIMGDLNDDPTDPSIAEVLGGKQLVKELKPGDLFNPYLQLFKGGYGSLAYQDVWNLFDNIVVSENLVTGSTGSLKLVKNGKKYYGFIFDRPFLRQQSGQYKGYPYRTYVGNNFQGGYSDHFPVYIMIE